MCVCVCVCVCDIEWWTLPTLHVGGFVYCLLFVHNNASYRPAIFVVNKNIIVFNYQIIKISQLNYTLCRCRLHYDKFPNTHCIAVCWTISHPFYFQPDSYQLQWTSSAETVCVSWLMPSGRTWEMVSKFDMDFIFSKQQVSSTQVQQNSWWKNEQNFQTFAVCVCVCVLSHQTHAMLSSLQHVPTQVCFKKAFVAFI